MNWGTGILAIALSLGLHGLVLKSDALRPAPIIAATAPPSNDARFEEAAAIEAFTKLDHHRALSQVVDRQLALMPELNAPKIAIAKKPEVRPKVQPASKPKKKEAVNTPQKTAPKHPVKKPASKASSYSEAQIQNAKNQFGAAVRKAVAQNMRVPRNVSGVRTVVALRFQKGRLVGYQIRQSSGNQSFDQAVIKAVKSARYPKAGAAAPPDVSYNIPLSVN